MNGLPQDSYTFRFQNQPPEFIINGMKAKLPDGADDRIARAVIRLHEEGLFTVWMVSHPSWQGDVSEKKLALLRESPLIDPVILDAEDKLVTDNLTVSKGSPQPIA